MGRQEIHLCRHREVTQFCRLTTRGRGFPAALSYRLFKTVANRVVAVSGKRAAVGFEDNKGIHRHAVAGGEDLRVVDAKVAAVSSPHTAANR